MQLNKYSNYKGDMMKKVLLSFATLLMLNTIVFAGDGEQWHEDLDEGLKVAMKENKPVLVDFTGSDWCGWCIKLDNEVFEKTAFTDYAKKNLVLVKVDFPSKKKQAAEQKEKNKKLMQQYGVRGFPTIVILDSTGKRVGTLGYVPGGPDAFIKAIEKVLDKKDS
jgi:protein disulfide-isomerase